MRYTNVMKKIVAIVFMLLISESVYSEMGRCESAMSTVVQKFRNFKRERMLRYVERDTYYKGNNAARVAMSILRNNPEPSVQIRIANAAPAIRSADRAIDVLKELARQEETSLELQEIIVLSMVEVLKDIINYQIEAREQAIQFLEGWFENNELHSKKLQDTFINMAVRIRGKRGFELLEKISDKHPSFKMEREFAEIASNTGGSIGVDMFKKRITERELSSEEQEIYAFYAGKMKGSYGLSVLDLLKEQKSFSNEKLEFAFLAGKEETHGARGGGSSSRRSSYGTDSTLVGIGVVGLAGF